MTAMIYGSVCSGIEAASVAWHPLGWRASFVSEIDPFPRAVLSHRFKDTPLHGDFTTIEAGRYEPIDLLVGGTPCQSFSVAGLRGGLGDDRGNLALEYLRLADRLRPRWLVWENVPGVLSSGGGRDFGSILGGMVELGYGFAYRVLDAQYVRVDGLERAVPQRRRRVFVVGRLGDWRRAAAVLFERESLCGYPAPRREAGERVAPTISARPSGGGGLGTDFDLDGGLIAANSGDVGYCLTASAQQSLDAETETLVAVAHSLRASGFDASEDGTGRGTPLVPTYTLAIRGRGDSHNLEYRTDGTANAILTPNGGRAGIGVGAVAAPIAFSAKDHGADAMENLSPTLRAGGHAGSHANAGVMPAIAIQERAVCENPNAGPDGAGIRTDGASYTLEARTVTQAVAFAQNQRDEVRLMNVAGALAAEPGMKQQTYVSQAWAVRRLTPTECERLQGFPEGWTDVPYRGKPASDGPRYKALGNSMAVNVMRWIGTRIAMVDRL